MQEKRRLLGELVRGIKKRGKKRKAVYLMNWSRPQAIMTCPRKRYQDKR
jgi:hypothetical protein